MLKTKYWAGDQSIEIHEIELDHEINEDPYHIILKDKHEDDIDKLTLIVINDCWNIYLYWASCWSFHGFVETLVIPEEYIMFLGAGSISAQLNLSNSTLIRSKDVNEFVGFIREKNCIIEQCYGECTAFSLKGEIINHHELDMMWDIEYVDGYFCTVCDFNGCRKLVKLDT